MTKIKTHSETKWWKTKTYWHRNIPEPQCKTCWDKGYYTVYKWRTWGYTDFWPMEYIQVDPGGLKYVQCPECWWRPSLKKTLLSTVKDDTHILNTKNKNVTTQVDNTLNWLGEDITNPSSGMNIIFNVIHKLFNTHGRRLWSLHRSSRTWDEGFGEAWTVVVRPR